MSGVCAMCHRKFEKLVSFSEWRGNCRHDTIVCAECRDKRASNGGTCKTCVHYDEERMNSKYRGGCEKYHRYVEIADRCGQYEEKKSEVCGTCVHCGWDSNWFDGCTDEIEWRVCELNDCKEVDEYHTACEKWEGKE